MTNANGATSTNSKKGTKVSNSKKAIAKTVTMVEGEAATVESEKVETPKVVKAKVEKPKKPEISFISAVYGAPAQEAIEAVEASEGVEAKAAIPAREASFVEFTAINKRKLTNQLVGKDPAPKVKKHAIIKALVDGVEVEKTFNEGEIIEF